MKPKQLLQNFQSEDKQEPETIEKAKKVVDSGLQMGPRRFTKQGNDGKFYAYGGNQPDAELDPKELAKAYQEPKAPKEPTPEREHIEEAQAAQKREKQFQKYASPFERAEKPKIKQGSPREAIEALGEESKPTPDFVKPLSKEGAEEARKMGISDDEYRYEKAKEEAIVMGKEFPEKTKFMEDLAQKRQASQTQAPQQAQEEPTDEDLLAEISDWEYIYGGDDIDHAADVLSARKNIPLERAKKFLESIEFDPNYGRGEPQAPKYQGGVALDMQNRGFEPYEVDEETQTLKVKDESGSEYVIKGDGRNAFDIYKDGNKIYSHVPNYYDLSTIVAGKPESDLKKYVAKQEQPQEATQQAQFPKYKEGDEVMLDGKAVVILPSKDPDKIFYRKLVYPYRTGYLDKGYEDQYIKPMTDADREEYKRLDERNRKFGYSSFTDY